jgi:hypothetical protein
MAVIFALLCFARYRLRGALWLAAACALYTGLSTALVLAHAPRDGSLDQHFGVWGGSPLGVLSTLLHEPGRVLAHFRAPDKLLYLPRLLAVLSFFPLRAARLLLPAAPYLALNLLSAFPTSCQQFSHYLTPAVPALVVAGVVGTTAIRKRAISVLWYFTLALAHFALGGSPLSRDFDRAAFWPDGASAAARSVLAVVPDGASVQAPDPLLAHLAERAVLRRAPPPLHDTDYVVLDVSHRQRYAHREDLLRTTEEPFVRAFFARGDHTLLRYAPPYALFVRSAASRASPELRACLQPGAAASADDVPLSACLSLRAAERTRDQLRLTLVAHAACPADLALRFGTRERPAHVELLCDGRLSPAQLRAGDLLTCSFALERELATAEQLWVGVLRDNGEPPRRSDPFAVQTSLERSDVR